MEYKLKIIAETYQIISCNKNQLLSYIITLPYNFYKSLYNITVSS